MIMTRITSNMVRRNYHTNLTNTLGGLESARKQVETGRRFAQSYEDPNSAAKAAILERRYARVEDQLNNVQNAQKWQDIQEDVVDDFSSIAKEIAKNYSVQGENGTNKAIESRDAFAQSLKSMQEQMVVILNAKYGDTFVLAGNEGKEPAFALNDDGKLTYRGHVVSELNANEEPGKSLLNEHSYIDLGFGMAMDGGTVSPASAFDTALPGIKLIGYGTTTVKVVDDNGNPVYEPKLIDGKYPAYQAPDGKEYYQDSDGQFVTADLAKVPYSGSVSDLNPVYEEEPVQKTDSKGRPLFQTADGTEVYKQDGNYYDAATNKLYDGNVSGYEVPDPADAAKTIKLYEKNGKYYRADNGEEYNVPAGVTPKDLTPQAVPDPSGKMQPKQQEQVISRNLVDLCGEMARVMSLPEGEFTYEGYAMYWDEFTDGANKLRDQYAALGTKTQLLTATKSRLENEKLAIQTQYDDAVGIEPAEAIMNSSWANYAYNSALKVGASLITPSLLDFIN